MAITERVDRQNAESAKFESADSDLEPLSHILTNPLSPLTSYTSPTHCTVPLISTQLIQNTPFYIMTSAIYHTIYPTIYYMIALNKQPKFRNINWPTRVTQQNERYENNSLILNPSSLLLLPWPIRGVGSDAYIRWKSYSFTMPSPGFWRLNYRRCIWNHTVAVAVRNWGHIGWFIGNLFTNLLVNLLTRLIGG